MRLLDLPIVPGLSWYFQFCGFLQFALSVALESVGILFMEAATCLLLPPKGNP